MSAGLQGNNQQASPTAWTEPPWSGWIETTGDALLILEAARRGLIPRVTRRLVDSERKMITSGSVFVFDEDESGIKRWTDGFFWSPSRILGNFLLYRETDKRGHRNARADTDVDTSDGSKPEGSLSRPKAESTSIGVDKHRERTLMGSLTNSYKFKPDGLMKKTFSLTIGGVAQHLISYYKIEDVENGRLRSPSSLPELASLEISPEYLDKTHFRTPPKVEVGADGIPRYRGEGDEVDTSPSSPSSVPANALVPNLPLLTDGQLAEVSSSSGKRTKRYIPYGPPNRSRKKSKSQADAPSTSDSVPTTPTLPDPPSGPAAASHHPLPSPHSVAPPAPDPNAPIPPQGAYPQYSYFPHPPPPLGYQPPHLGTAPYPHGGYPPSSSQLPPPPVQQQVMPQYAYPYPPAPLPPQPSAVPAQQHPTQAIPDSSQQPAPQPYYPYYPPPHPHPHPNYAPYPPPPAGAAWPYQPIAYPSQQQPQPQPYHQPVMTHPPQPAGLQGDPAAAELTPGNSNSQGGRAGPGLAEG